MIEFDVECQRCKKLITLRVRDERARMFFEQNGARCEACHERPDQHARTPCSVQPAAARGEESRWLPCT